MYLCTNHPHTTARAGCGQCARPFCDDCLVSFQGALLCGACRNALLARMQGAHQVVYSPARRQKTVLVAIGIFLAVFLGSIFLGLALAAVTSAFAPHLAWIPGVGGFLVGVWGSIALSTPLSQLGTAQVREDVTRKLVAGGLTPEFLQQGMFVGIGAGELLQNYHGDVHWDVGYLLAGPGWLAYYGDQTHFSLRPDQVTALEINPVRGNATFTVCRLMIRWRDERAQLSGVMNVMAHSFKSRKDARAQLEGLRARLEAWRTQPVTTPVSAGWPLPPVSVRGGSQTAAVTSEPGGFWRQLAIGIPLALVVAVGIAVLKTRAGVDIPVWVGIMFCIIASQMGAAAWNKRIAERKAREREQGEAADGGATTLRT